jgi:transposase
VPCYDQGEAEGINSKIMSITRRAGGYRNIKNFKKSLEEVRLI